MSAWRSARQRRLPVATVAAVLLTGLLAAAPAQGAPTTHGLSSLRASAGVTAAAEVDARVGRYTPRTGVLTNDPRQTTKRRIMRHLIRTIQSTRPGESIRIISWNVASPVFVREMLAANARGVSVRLLMSQEKADEQTAAGDFWRLRRGLRNRSKTHPQPDNMRSWARGCERSCRGKGGIAHSKMYMFSRAGKAKYVVMSSSANATEVSVNSQWNDMYTLVGNEKVYNKFIEVFNEAAKDQQVKPGYVTVDAKYVSAYFYPWNGRNAIGDRAMNELNKITCKGATGGTGVAGRTRIRIAQDAIINERGIRLAKKLRDLWQRGCNIRIVYALLGSQARYVVRHTSRGPIPHQQIVSDFNADGVYDRYLHAKIMTVSGRYGKDSSARVAWQGSENWSGLAKLSDEQGFKIWRGGAEQTYTAWIDWLFFHPPPPPPPTTEARVRAAGIDPYAIIKANM